jgi:phosphate-selective porin OprO/OprP
MLRKLHYLSIGCLAGLLLGVRPVVVRAEESQAAIKPATVETELNAGEEDDPRPERKFTKWNSFDGPISSLKYGGGLLVDYAGYAQDADSKQQVRLIPEAKLRDARVLLDGKFKTDRPFTWCAGLMYDGPTHSWLVRQTGFMVGVPEIWSHFFIGRQKEGFSLNKVMVGYAGWTMERATISDATIPILADGIKWMGLTPDHHLRWDVGVYGDTLSEQETFSTYDKQVVTRLNWLPMNAEGGSNKLLHLGVMARYGNVDNDQLTLRSRPEAFAAPYFVDTGKLSAGHTRMIGWEAYYRPGSWMFGSEYWFTSVASPAAGNPLLHGGDLVQTWLATGEIRPYNMVNGCFKAVAPAKSVFNGGPGAWEIVMRESYIDLNDSPVQGGKFWRITPMVNWYLSDQLRLETAYGYGTLDRFGVNGATHFFQLRLQIWI